MFRHADTFVNHSFHRDWSELKELINEVDNKKITGSDALIEFARLNKCIKYADSYFKMIDLDLLTQSNVNQLKKIEFCICDIIDEYISDGRLEHLKEANNQIDGILRILNNFHTLLPKASEKSIATMLETYSDTLDESLSQINLPEVVKASNQIQLLKQLLIDGEGDNESIKLQIENLLTDFENKHVELIGFYDQALNPENEDTIAKSIKTNQELLEKYKRDATDDVNELTNKIDAFDKFYITVFGEKDSETSERLGGLKAELKNRMQELDEFKESQEVKYSTLVEEIKSLLPDATSAGLASAYNDERRKFEEPLKRWNWIFIGSLVAIFLVTLCSFSTFSSTADGFDLTLSRTGGIIENISALLHRLPFYLPFVWLAVYASKRRSELQRLDQEYAHKEALAKSYSSYKDQIDRLNENKDILASKLLGSAIDATSKNPSETLGKHSANMPFTKGE